ncbi:putative tripartite motif-containing protein 75 [Rana temporaria]|uniref:putative tripartite motif-containing protein 75 n=1 Tax=Rana temporaria TaxID=8407 RepID=UPI001AAD6ACF|nr:putative tripartite motif-containing protein 75 [Rana temporaria]
MAFSDARKELDCSICLNIYTNPVTLRCGHNFCRDCIEDVLDTQEGSGVYCCPECREEFQERPEFRRNRTVCNMESFRSTEPEKKESQIFCTQCIHSPVPAVKSCLLCEASLCDDHLRVHSKLHGDHQEHQVEALEEASQKRKENLTNALQELVKKREEMEESIKSLQKYKRKVQDSADGVTKRVTALFRDIRRQLDILERRVLKEITMKAERVSFPASDLIQDLEIKKDDLSRKIRHIEEICNMTDPLTFLQESDTGLSDIITGVCGAIILEPADILLDADTAHNYLNIPDDRKTAQRIKKMLNRPNTQERFRVYRVQIGTVLNSNLDRNGTLNREVMSVPVFGSMSDSGFGFAFHSVSTSGSSSGGTVPQYSNVISPQVMSSQSFSSGRHYWDVDVGGSSHWRVGMCYPSIARTGEASEIGCSEKSWCLERNGDTFLVKHNNKSTNILANIPIHRVRVCLDYKAGRLSFYKLDIPIRLLHTLTDLFTEPLHAALYVGGGYIKLGGWERDM